MTTHTGNRPITQQSLAVRIRNQLRGADGLRVVDSGALAADNGYPRGTGWVEIEADSLLDCDVAEFRLNTSDCIMPVDWANGWTLSENSQRETSFRLRLYLRH